MSLDSELPFFRGDHVDAIVWEWIRGLFDDPEVALEGLRHEQATREKALKPLRDRLAIVDDLLAEHQAQLERTLDLYLSGDFDKEVLIDRRTRLERTISDLERERAKLTMQMKTHVLTDEQITTLMRFVGKLGKGLEAAEADFNKRRQLIEDLDVKGILAVEDDKKMVHISCVIGKDVLAVAPTGISTL